MRIWIPLLACLMLLIAPAITQAQTTEIVFDFTESHHDWFAPGSQGVWVEDVGWQGSLVGSDLILAITNDGTVYENIIGIRVTYFAPNGFRDFEFDHNSAEFGVEIDELIGAPACYSLCAGEPKVWNFVFSNPGLTIEPDDVDNQGLQFYAKSDVGQFTLTEVALIQLDDPDSEDWIRPFSPDDEDESWNLFDYNLVQAIDPDYFGELPVPFTTEEVLNVAVNGTGWEFGFCTAGPGNCTLPNPFVLKHLLTPDLNTVIATSNDIGDSVMAAVDATVVSVEKLTEENCADLVEPLVPDLTNCHIKIPPVIAGTPNPLIELIYDLDLTNSYIVTLSVPEIQLLRYIVDEPMVQAGDSIQAGCILGKSVEIIAVPQLTITSMSQDITIGLGLSLGGPTFGASITASITESFVAVPVTKGVTIMTLYEEQAPPAENIILPLLQNLTVYSSPLQACNADPRYRSCAGDPELRDPDDWITTGNVQWLYPGANLFPSARIDMQLPLLADTAYSLTVVAELLVPGADQEITIQLGTTEVATTIVTPVAVANSYTIESAIPTPDIGTFYTVAVANSGDAPFRIISVCATEGAPNTTPSGCYFFNSSFDLGASGWTSDPDVQFIGGDALVLPGDTISQLVHLFPDDGGPHEYLMKVRAELWHAPTLNLLDLDPEVEEFVTMEYDWPESTGYVEMDYVGTFLLPDPTFGAFAAQPSGNYFIAQIEVTEETSGMMVIRPTIDENPAIFGVRILSVCIEGPYPQQDFGPQLPPFAAHCEFVSPPDGQLLSSWISFLWGKLNQFFQCQLMTLLNRMYQTMLDAFRLMGWIQRWSMALTTYLMNWFSSQLIPWLNGHFRNMAAGNLTYVQAGEGAGFWDVLLALINNILSPIINLITGLISQIAELLLTVVAGIITIIFGIVGQIVGLLNLVLGLLASIITSYHSAAPATIPGAPDCSNPQSSGFCVANWVLENTIFSGPGTAIIPVIIAIGSILFVLWAIGAIKEAVVQSVQAS